MLARTRIAGGTRRRRGRAGRSPCSSRNWGGHAPCLRLAKHEQAQAQQERAEPPAPNPLRHAAAPAPARRVSTVTFTKGDTVRVRRYGRGPVAGADVMSVTVEFADGSRRTFQPDFVARYKSGPAHATAPV